MRAMIADGISTIAIAKYFRMSRRNVRLLVAAPKSEPRYSHTEATIRRTFDLWLLGLKTRKIAEMLSQEIGRQFTRNSVIGMAHVNAFPKRPSPIKRASAAQPPQRRRIQASRPHRLTLQFANTAP